MITKFTAKGFKTLVDVEIELGQVNVFIGANGSGKSNVLEALGVLAAAAYGRVDEESLVRRGVRPGGYMRPLFNGSSQTSEIAFSAEAEAASYSVVLKSPEAGRRTGWEFRQETWALGDDVLLNRIGQNGNVKGDPQVGLAALRLAETERENPAALLLKRLSAYSIYTPDTPILRGWTPDIQIREPLGLSGGRLAEAVGEMINGDHHDEELSHLLKAVPWFGAFGVESLHKQEAYEHSLSFIDRYFGDEYRNKYLLSSNDVNEGVLYLLFAVVLCLHPNAPPLLAIDNADHSLNPLLTLELMTAVSGWVLSSTQKRQIVLTTHDPLALDGLPLQDDRVRLFTVDRDNRGHTQVRRLKITDKHREMAAKGWTLSRMWVNKLLGGVPDV